MSNSPKKALTIAVSAMTAMWSVGVAAFAPLAAAAAPSAAAVAEGDLVKASLPAVYYVGANGKRYVFPNEKTYKTWWTSFSTVKTITDAELAAVAIGGNVTYRPGARLVKITTDPKVYLVGGDASLHPIADEGTALDLFGSSWSQKVDDVSDAFFTNYTVSSEGVATGLGMGALPVGTLVSFGGNHYVVGENQNYMVTGDVSIYGAVVMPGDASEFSAWMGEAASSITDSVTASELLDLFTPDRAGVEEGGTGSTPSTSGVTVEGTLTSTELSMSSASSQNVGRAEIKICAGSNPITINELRTSFASGTVSANTTMSWFDFGGAIYEQSGTEANDTIALYESNDTDVTISGCQNVSFYASTNSTSGVVHIRMKSVNFTSAAASAAAMVESTFVLMNRNAVSVASSDLMDFSITSATSPAAVQAEGTSFTQLYSAQVSFSNNDAYVPNAVFRVNGSLVTNGCEFRIAGAVVATQYTWAGKHIVFEIPSAMRVMQQTSKTWELWCKVIGEAGQTVTISMRYPAPHFYFFDNDRTAAAVVDVKDVSKVNVNQGTSILNATPANSITVSGSSATVETVNLNNAKDTAGALLDDEKTSGSTNTTVAIFKVRVRGSKATLSSLTLAMTGTHAAKGMSGCQIKIGQRTDKGEIVTTNVMLGDYSLSNFGGENNLVAANVLVSSTKQMAIGDWLIVIECDVNTAGAAYANADVMSVSLIDANLTNLSFDQGTSVDLPAANTAGTTITIRLASALLTVASNNTTRFLVGNATNVILGEYTLTGSSQEGSNVTSIGITFEGSGAAANNVVGVDGCTTVELQNISGTSIASSQSLTATAADVTLTFSVTFTIAQNAQYKVRVVCVQAASAPTAGTVTNATVLATISGTGVSSSQSFSVTPGTLGANVTKAAAGSATIAAGVNQPNQIVGPSEQLKIATFTLAASIHEDQSLNTFSVVLTGAGANAATLANELSDVVVKAEGFTVNGQAAAAAEQTICTRIVTGTGAARTLTCNFSDNTVVLGASQTGVITVYATGNTLGNIGASAPATHFVTPTIVNNNNVATDHVVMKGKQSQTLIVTNVLTVTGRVVTPTGTQLRFVNKSIPSTTQPGQSDMVLAKRDVIVGGSNIVLTDLGGLCLTSDTTDICNATEAIDLVLDNTVINTVNFAPDAYLHTGLTTLVTVGTHNLESRADAPLCSTGDTIQLTSNRLGFTVGAQTFTLGAAGAFPVTIVADFNTFGSNNMTHPSNLCG